MQTDPAATVEFWKVQALGNDFILFNDADATLELTPEYISRICDRHFGIGADGILVVRPCQGICEFEMIYFNADGSLAEMCGNGIRCFAKWVFDHGLTATTQDLRIMTGAGIKNVHLDVVSRKVTTIRVDMGPPQFEAAAIPVIGQQNTLSITLPFPGYELEGAAVSMGNPHCVLFVDHDPSEMDVGTIGPAIENNITVFPEKTNVQFVKVIDRNNVKARIWERGVGETLASGTSSCAIVAAGVKRGLLDPVCIVHLPGGELSIDWQESTSIFMTGAAEEVFSGTIEL